MLVDGNLVFSKAERGRFPNEGEVERAFAALKEGKELPPLDPPRSGFIERVLDKLKS